MEHTAAVVRLLFGLVFIGWLAMWIMLPTKTYKETWTLALSKHLNSTYFREQGTNLVLFSFPIMFLASFGCIYLHFQTMSTPKSTTVVKKSRLDIFKRPLIVMNPLGIVNATEFLFSAMFIVLLGWSLGNYLYVSFGHLHMDKGVQMWQSKFRSVWLRLGYIGHITWAFLFFPVTRGSSILRLVGLTSESSVKYHIWLGHLSMVLFTAHSVGFFIYWGITHQMVLALQWSQTYLSNVAGEIAFVIALIMWVTSITRVRRKMFELFYYTHQTYMLYVFFYIIHVGVAYFCLILPGIFLFLIDRYLRFLQSRTSIRLIAARVLPCDTLELNFSKISGLEYTPSSILFVNVPLISKMQWHPFTVTSNANMDPDTLSIVIKCQGTWSHKLYQQLSSSPIDRLQVSVEGPYGPASAHFLRYENLVLISGGSGITPFISVIRELSFQRAQQQQQPNKNHTIPTSVLLICAFKNSTDLSMLDLLLPLTSNSTPSDLSQINLQIQAYITRETEQQQPLENTKKPLQKIWFKPNPSDSPISTPLGPNSWLWLCVIITSSFIMFLIFLGILIRYHIYPVELAKGPSAYNYTFKTLWDMFFVCASVFLATSFVFLLQKKDNDKSEATKVQDLELSEVGEIESLTHQSVREITNNVHFGGRPDLKTMLMENNKKGSAVGVMACGPRKMRHEVAKICSSNLASNLHMESMSFNWSEKTKIGRMISAALVSILLGLAASNMGIIPHEARAYSVVMKFVLPLTIPLMLFRADMRNVIKSTGKLLLAFLIGSVATMIGTLVAYLIVPMRSLGQDSWKIASALMASYIGGAINYVAVSDALAVSPSVIAAGVAADNVICAIYFMALFALGSKLPTEALPSTKAGPANNLDSGSGDNAPVLQTATALAVSFAICKGATHVVRLLKCQGSTLPAITAIVVILATLLPRQIGYLAPAGDAISAISIQVFFAVLGASGSIWNVINVAPSIFVFAFIQVTVHLIVVLGLGKLLRLDLKLLLLASNANIGGPTTASGMATAKGWGSLVVPGILVGIFGISIATYIAYFFGIYVLKGM